MYDFFLKPKRQWIEVYMLGTAWKRLLIYAKFFILAGAILVLNPIQGCANQHMVGMDQNETTVKLKVNEVLRIELPGNAGTGFEWRFSNWDDTFFVLLGSHQKIFEEDNPDHVGNAYLKSWSIKAAKVGSHDIRMLYYRIWEGEKMAEKKFSIKVIVEH